MILDDRALRPLPVPGIDPARLVLVTAPAVEVWTIADAEVQQHFRLDSDQDASMVTELLKASRRHFENITGLALITQTWRMELDRTPRAAGVEIPRAPLIASGDPAVVVSSVQYLDTDGATQTLAAANYVQPRAGIPRALARLRLAPDGSWPDLGDYEGALRITFTAGFGAASTAVPSDIRVALLWFAKWWYERPEGVAVGNIVNELPHHLTSLIESNRVAFIG
jgi:uncharacterized phiE125 gp8 family phage protein